MEILIGILVLVAFGSGWLCYKLTISKSFDTWYDKSGKEQIKKHLDKMEKIDLDKIKDYEF